MATEKNKNPKGDLESLGQRTSIMPLPEDEELEKYGVWVKVGPEDMIEEYAAEEDFKLQDLETGVEPEEETILTPEEEELLGNLQNEIPEEEEILSETEDFSVPEIDIDSEIQDFERGKAATGEIPAEVSESIESLDEDFSDISLDNLEEIEQECVEGEKPAEEKLELEEVLEEQPLREEAFEEKISESEEELIEIPLEEPLEALEEQRAETLEVEAIAPETGQLDVELMEEEAVAGAAEDVSGGIEITDSTLPMAEENLDEIDIAELEQSDYGEELPELEVEDIGEDIISEEAEEISELTDVEEIREPEELETTAEAASTAVPVEERPPVVSEDSSTSILLKIEKELLAIKEELVALKHELSSLKTVEIIQKEPAPEEAPKSTGFFEEEEDETIALTGDELDNILNTAEITEQTAKPGYALDEIDETLTGDELDNILNTAEIKEETVETVFTPEESGEIAVEVEEPVEEIPEPEDIIPLEPEKTADELEISLEEGLSESPEPQIEPKEEKAGEINLFDTARDELVIPGEESIELETFREEEAEITLSDEEVLETMEQDLAETTTEEGKPNDNALIDEIEISVPEEPLPEIPPSMDIEVEEGLDIITEHEESLVMEEPEIQEEPKVSETIELELPEEETVVEIPETEPIETAAETEIVIESREEEAKPEEQAAEIETELPEMPEIEIEEERPEEAESKLEAEPGIEIETEAYIPDNLKEEIKSVLSYMDQLLESLPEEKIIEFAKSDHFLVYKKLFEDLGLKQ
ncbi:MAG: hypothetical protein AB1798_02940 [Spirochaetota bacterium]